MSMPTSNHQDQASIPTAPDNQPALPVEEHTSIESSAVTFSCGKQTRNAKEFMEILETVELPFPRGAVLDRTAYQEWIKLTTEYQEFKVSHPGRKGGKNGQCKWTPLQIMINKATDTQKIAQYTGKRRFVSAMVSFDKFKRGQVFIDTTKEPSLHFATLTVPAKGVIPVEELIPCAAKRVAEDPTTTWADFLAFCMEKFAFDESLLLLLLPNSVPCNARAVRKRQRELSQNNGPTASTLGEGRMTGKLEFNIEPSGSGLRITVNDRNGSRIVSGRNGTPTDIPTDQLRPHDGSTTNSSVATNLQSLPTSPQNDTARVSEITNLREYIQKLEAGTAEVRRRLAVLQETEPAASQVVGGHPFLVVVRMKSLTCANATSPLNASLLRFGDKSTRQRIA